MLPYIYICMYIVYIYIVYMYTVHNHPEIDRPWNFKHIPAHLRDVDIELHMFLSSIYPRMTIHTRWCPHVDLYTPCTSSIYLPYSPSKSEFETNYASKHPEVGRFNRHSKVSKFFIYRWIFHEIVTIQRAWGTPSAPPGHKCHGGLAMGRGVARKAAGDEVVCSVW